MNADLKNALLEVKAYFLEASANENVVEFTAPNLTTNDLLNLFHIHRKNPKIKPWVFRSDKEVKVVFFITDLQGKYMVSDGEYVDSDTFETSLTDPENQPNQWGFGNELPSLIPDNVSSREEWIEYVLTINGIPVHEILSNAGVLNKNGITPIASFMEHLQSSNVIVPEEVYESYFENVPKQLITGISIDTESDLTFNIESIIESELPGKGSDLPYSSVRKVAEKISEYLGDK